jgi:hypothetical protein
MTDDKGTSPVLTWPNVPRLAFGSGAEAHLNATVSWALGNPRDLTHYIDGYREAAEAVFERVDAGASPDHMLFPFAFLWRHCIELRLKEIIAIGRSLDGKEWGFPEHHGLLDLWREAKPYVIQTAPKGGKRPEVRNVEANIKEFEKIDPSAEGFRYSLDKKGKRSLPRAPNLVNLRKLHEAVTAVANLLSGVSSVLQEQLEYMMQRPES